MNNLLNNEERKNLIKITELWLNLEKSVERVRKLHQSIFEPIMESQIGAHWCTGCDEPYPCSTIKALDGEQ